MSARAAKRAPGRKPALAAPLHGGWVSDLPSFPANAKGRDAVAVMRQRLSEARIKRRKLPEAEAARFMDASSLTRSNSIRRPSFLTMAG